MGPFTAPQKVQEVAGLSSLPDVQWATRTSIFDVEEEEEGSRGTDCEKPERLQYCDLNWDQLLRVQEYSGGEEVIA